MAETLTFPDLERDYEFVCLSHPDEYPLNEGRLISNKGLDIDISEYDDHIEEIHVERSNALQSRIKERGAYLCGPMARYNLNFDKLPEGAKALAEEIGLLRPVRNPFKSILVRGIETYFAFHEALRILKDYEPDGKPYVEVPRAKGTGWGCTEAPRGICYHRYSTDDDGVITDAKIVAPTSQNQQAIEEDLSAIAGKLVSMPLEEATVQAELAIRNYDPCISCATHFLKFKVEEED
jgi:coenzyme F420-reducing hydrogenase alpha subunit